MPSLAPQDVAGEASVYSQLVVEGSYLADTFQDLVSFPSVWFKVSLLLV